MKFSLTFSKSRLGVEIFSPDIIHRGHHIIIMMLLLLTVSKIAHVPCIKECEMRPNFSGSHTFSLTAGDCELWSRIIM